MLKLTIPVTYQGGKARIAKKICDEIALTENQNFVDMCCGSGAISVEMINRGLDPSRITMIDAGPYGLFWWEVSVGKFNLDKLQNYCDELNKQDIRNIPNILKDLAQQPAHIDTAQVFLLLQAGSFGSKAVWIKDGKWKHHGFRTYWETKSGCNRKSHTNPTHPNIPVLFERVENIVEGTKGIVVVNGAAERYNPKADDIIYIDPPYGATTGYGFGFDAAKYAQSVKNKCYVSEWKPLCKNAKIIHSSQKAGINGKAGASTKEEWLSIFN